VVRSGKIRRRAGWTRRVREVRRRSLFQPRVLKGLETAKEKLKEE
jgi:hypothetical protein